MPRRLRRFVDDVRRDDPELVNTLRLEPVELEGSQPPRPGALAPRRPRERREERRDRVAVPRKSAGGPERGLEVAQVNATLERQSPEPAYRCRLELLGLALGVEEKQG